MSGGDDRSTNRAGRGWQLRVWVRIALDRAWRLVWPDAAASTTVAHRGGNMRDGARSDLRLERPRRLRRRWLRAFAKLVGVIGLGIALTDRTQHCAASLEEDVPSAALEVCRLEFQRTQSPISGELLAEAEYRNDSSTASAAAVKQFASRFLATPARARALQFLGVVSLFSNEIDDAIKYLQQARREHQFDIEELSRDDGWLASAQTKRGDFADALRTIDECIVKMANVNEEMECYCHVVAARTLIQIGYFGQANLEIEAATKVTGCAASEEQIDLAYQLGNLEWESGHSQLAANKFQWVLIHSTPASEPTRWIDTELNLANALAKLGRFGEARVAITEAELRDTEHHKDAERMWTEARLAYEQGHLPEAASWVEQYFNQVDHTVDSKVDRDDKIAVAALAAQIELARDALESAANWAQRGINIAESIRREQATLELRPEVLARRRDPYELRFTALARSKRFDEAAIMFDQWQGRTVEDALTRLNPPKMLDRNAVAGQVTQLGTWLKVASRAGFAKPTDADAVLRRMRDVDLLALVVANDEIWRLSAHHGTPRLEQLGRLDKIKHQIEDFSGAATDVKLSSELGALLIPEEDFRSTSEKLYVVIDGRLGALPFAALRHGATPLVALRPFERLLRLPDAGCAHVSHSGGTAVLVAVDQEHSARSEAVQVAQSLHTTPTFNATKNELLDASHDEVLHVIAHGNVDPDETQDEPDGAISHGGSLNLVGGEVSAFEISARGVGPSLVVLPVCSAAVSYRDDLEIAGSVTSGFLAAGSLHVVATVGSVSDDGATEVATKFYLAGGVDDPARALTRVQANLAETDGVANPAWPHFAVFGRDVCEADARKHL